MYPKPVFQDNKVVFGDGIEIVNHWNGQFSLNGQRLLFPVGTNFAVVDPDASVRFYGNGENFINFGPQEATALEGRWTWSRHSISKQFPNSTTPVNLELLRTKGILRDADWPRYIE